MNEAGVPKFVRPTGTEPTPHVLIGGAEADLLHLRDALQRLGAIRITDPVPPRLAHCYASFSSAAEAAAALDAISALPPGETAGRVVAHFADVAAPRPSPDAASASAMPIPAVRTAAECNVQGLSLLHDFVSREEEAAVLAAVDTQPWELLARRRVQHYGTKFSYVVSLNFGFNLSFAVSWIRTAKSTQFFPNCNC